MRKFFFTVITYLIIPCVVWGQGCVGETSDNVGATVAGYFQPQFNYLMKTYAKDEEVTFTFNRARLGVYGNIPYDIHYYVFAEVSPSKGDAPYLLDAFVSYVRLVPYAKFTVGQFKSPFSLELNTSCAGLHTINRSKVVAQLSSPDRDIGLMISGKFKDLVSYSLAILNGTGRIDNNKKKDVAARMVFSPLKLISLGISGRYGKSAPQTSGATEEDRRTRMGGELQFKFANLLAQTEYVFGRDIGSIPIVGGCGSIFGYLPGTSERNGFFIQGMYMTPVKVQPVIKYEFWDPDMDADNDREQVITFGLNYFLNMGTRVQINYLYCAEEIEVVNDQILCQIQVKF